MKHITKKPIKRKLYETKSWFFGKIDKPLLSLTPPKKGKIQIIRIRNKREDITTILTETERIIKKYYK